MLKILTPAVADPATDIVSLRREIAALPDHDDTRLAGSQQGLADVRQMALRDLDAFARRTPSDPTSLGEFLRKIIARYEDVLAHLAPG